MNHIHLGFQKDEQKGNEQIGKVQNRPEKINVDKLKVNNKWAECKVLGKNISIRSYSANAIHSNTMYVYGGYQIYHGILTDFYQINLDSQQTQYNWKFIQPKGQYPGPRSRHSLIATNNRLYLFGGLKNDTKSCNSLYSCSYDTHQWTKINPLGQPPPPLDSFGSAYLNTANQEKILVFGGYNQSKSDYTNSIYEYNITTNKWTILFDDTKQSKQAPCARSGCSIAIFPQQMDLYIFGGRNEEGRLNDLWKFNLNTMKFTQLFASGIQPLKRNGHSLSCYKSNLYLFGGIHDITWELDDLMIYHIKKNQWLIVEQESPRKIQQKNKNNLNPQIKIKEQIRQNNKKKLWYETSPAIYRQSTFDQFMIRQNTALNTENGNSHSPGKMIEEQKRKAFLNRKAQMLRHFEVKQKEREKFINMQTMSQAMKNSLDVIGLPQPNNKAQQGKLTDFGKTSVSKFLQPLASSEKDTLGKKPCARDGHCVTIMGNILVIFGGDRHQMSFNDIYKLDLTKIVIQ